MMILRLLLLGIAALFVRLAMIGRSGPRAVFFARHPATGDMLISTDRQIQ